MKRRIDLHLEPFFRKRKMSSLTTADVRAFVAERQEKSASIGEINRELTALRRMYTLALQAGKLMHRPHIPMLAEHNVRVGFFEAQQFALVLAKLKPAQRAAAKFAHLTGWQLLEERKVVSEATAKRQDKIMRFVFHRPTATRFAASASSGRRRASRQDALGGFLTT